MSFNIRSNLSSTAVIVLTGFMLAGCDTTREALGLKRNQPDEFTVLKTAPLTLPPNFNDLPQPNPGADRPQEPTSREKARQAVLVNGESAGPSTAQAKSAGEDVLLEKAGAQENLKDVRQKVDKEANVESRNQDSFIKDVVSFNKTQPGDVIDPVEENKKLNNAEQPAVNP